MIPSKDAETKNRNTPYEIVAYALLELSRALRSDAHAMLELSHTVKSLADKIGHHEEPSLSEILSADTEPR